MLMTVGNVVERMNKLMLQLRTGARPVEQPRSVDLESVIRNVCAAKSEQNASIDMDLAVGSTAWVTWTDSSMSSGIWCKMRSTQPPSRGRVSVRLRRDDNTAVIEVTDSGVGMTPEFVRDRLFKPFQTTKAAGMGVGVYEARNT